jgi:RIO kinase 1
VSGEHRFRRGYNRKNPRKMVRLWAEKELRNLRRLRAAGIPCPEPLEVRENVLVMSFLGNREGWCAESIYSYNIPDFIGFQGGTSVEGCRDRRPIDLRLFVC